MKYLITTKRNVQLLSIGQTLKTGDTTLVDKMTKELERARQLGMITLEEVPEESDVMGYTDDDDGSDTREPEEEVVEESEAEEEIEEVSESDEEEEMTLEEESEPEEE